jgi:hypothetical protein
MLFAPVLATAMLLGTSDVRLERIAASPTAPPSASASTSAPEEEVVHIPLAPDGVPDLIVGDKASAIRIGAAIIESAIGEEEYKDYLGNEWQIDASDKGDHWAVVMFHPGCREKRAELYFCTGGSAYTVQLNKKDGRVGRIGRGR